MTARWGKPQRRQPVAEEAPGAVPLLQGDLDTLLARREQRPALVQPDATEPLADLLVRRRARAEDAASPAPQEAPDVRRLLELREQRTTGSDGPGPVDAASINTLLARRGARTDREETPR